MRPASREPGTEDLTSLELLGLGRIPRCARCARYAAYVEAVSGGASRLAALPPVPDECAYQVCTPLAARLLRPLNAVRRAGTG